MLIKVLYIIHAMCNLIICNMINLHHIVDINRKANSVFLQYATYIFDNINSKLFRDLWATTVPGDIINGINISRHSDVRHSLQISE